ncbi:MAG: hypothetical protein ACPGSL_04095 [Vicingaceae bacterium]
MKKIYLTIIIIVAIALQANAQVENHTIGVRLGGSNYGPGFEASYQHGLGDVNRAEIDLGWSGNNGFAYMKLTGMYHWVWEINESLNWYAGPGLQFVQAFKSGLGSSPAVGAGGQVGLEYNFKKLDLPLVVGLDTRPMFHLGNNYFDAFGWGIALSARYSFEL